MKCRTAVRESWGEGGGRQVKRRRIKENTLPTYFQPIAKPHDGSRNRVEKAEKEPATGKATASSPRACTVK
jgi:hypothetical protein